MIAVDTNILVYAHRSDSPFHRAAFAKLSDLAASGKPWAIPWPCVHEFIGVVTYPRGYSPPSTPEQAAQQIDALLESPSVALLAETGIHWQILRTIVVEASVSGRVIHDAKIAAICLQHDVTELWTCDRDYSRFPGLRLINPLVG